MAQVQIVVSVDDRHLDQVAQVARGLERAGMTVEQELDAAGVVTGSVEDTEIPALSQVDGVASVEESRAFQLPPPDSPVL